MYYYQTSLANAIIQAMRHTFNKQLMLALVAIRKEG
jgi:hypothetical protein